MDHIQSLLDNAIVVAEKLQQGTSTLLVEKEGCSRGLQLSSLASIMLDPYYRTMEGFIVLVEKEWLSFGHKVWVSQGALAACEVLSCSWFSSGIYIPLSIQKS